MQVQANISFDQLLKAVKLLPKRHLHILKAEIEKEFQTKKSKIDLENLLLNGPTATEEQLKTIEDNGKAINR